MVGSQFDARRTAIAAVLFLCATVSIGAQRTGPFVGGGIGVGSTDLAISNTGVCFDGYYGPYDCEIDDDILIVEVHGGYRVNPYFAVEGKVLGAANDGNDDGDELSFGAISARAVGLIPISEVAEIYGLIGLYTGESDVGYYDSEDESGLVYGGGAQLNFGATGKFGVRLEYEVYETDEFFDDVRGFTASFQYNFF